MEHIITSTISSFIRGFIENPLEIFLSSIPLRIEGMVILIFIIKYWPMIMHTLTFAVVGGAYKKGEFPALGSILYLIVFAINSKILNWIVLWLGVFGIGWVVCAFLIVCLLEYIGMCKARNYILYSDGFRAL